MPPRAERPAEAAAVRRNEPTTSCWATACRPSGWPTCEQATEDTLLGLADHLPAEAAEALLELATGGTPAGPQAVAAERRSVRPSRRPAPLPRHAQRRGAANARSTIRGRSGRSSSIPRSEQLVERELQRPGARLRLGRHRQDHRRAASGRPPRPHASRCARAADDLLRHAWRTPCGPGCGACSAMSRGWPNGSTCHSLDAIGAPALQGACRCSRGSTSARDRQALMQEAGDCGERPQVRPAFPADGMGAGGRRLAARELGGLSRRRAARPQDTAAGSTAQGAVVDLRAGPRRPGTTGHDHHGRRCSRALAESLSSSVEERRSISPSWTRRRT